MDSEQLKKLRQWLIAQPEFEHLLRISQEFGAGIFLVGGLVRDSLLARDTRDVDLTLSRESLNVAKHFAEWNGGTFVLLRTEGEMARVVLGNQTFDFTNFRGPDLEADLRGRDFTINAIALSLDQAFTEKEWVPIDPLNGILDLQNRVLRMAAPDSFEQDPLRMLRAFRFAAQLGMTLDPETGKAIEKSAPLLTRSAPERIHYEWLVLLSQPAGFASVQAMEQVGLFKILFPEMEGLKGIDQDRYHHLDVFRHSLLTFQYVEELIQKVIPLPKALEEEATSYLKGNNKAAWLKWAALLHDLGKAITGAEKAGHKTFYGHAESSQNLFNLISQRFRPGNREKDFINQMIGWHLRPFYLVHEESQKTLTRRAVIRLVREAGEELNGLFLLALADSLAAQGKEKPKDQEDRLIELWRKALFTRDEIIRPLEKISPLVSGSDLIGLGFTPGPLFKTILSELWEEQMVGRIGNRVEALEWVKARWDRG